MQEVWRLALIQNSIFELYGVTISQTYTLRNLTEPLNMQMMHIHPNNVLIT